MRFAKQWALTGLATVVLMGVPREAAAFWDWIHELSGPSMMGFGYTCRLVQPTTFGSQKTRLEITAKGKPHGREQGSLLTLTSGSFRVTPLTSLSFTIDVPTRLAEKVQREVEAALPDTSVTVEPRSFSVSFDRCFKGTPPPGNYLISASESDRFHWWVRPQAFVYYSVKHEDDPDGPPVYAVSYGGLFELSPTHPGKPGKSVLFYGVGGECFTFWSGGDRSISSNPRCAVKFRPVGIRINPPIGERILGLKALEVGMDTRYFPRAFVPRDFGVNIGPEERDGGEWTIGLFFSAVLR
jgi:hypothetical protein